MPLASHLKISRHGVYYFRVIVPVSLRPAFGGRSEIKKSLGTREPRIAKRFAYNLSSYVLALFDEVKQMAGNDPKRFNPNDQSTWPTSGTKYEIDMARGIFKTDPSIPGDHEKMMDAIDRIGMFPIVRPEKMPSSMMAEIESAVANTLKTLPAVTANPVRRPEKISVVIKAYIADARNRLAEKTPDVYESNCLKFLGVVKDKYIHEVNEEDIIVFKEWCNNDAKLKQQSLDGRLGPISGLLKYAQKKGHFPKGSVPTVGMFELTMEARDQCNKFLEKSVWEHTMTEQQLLENAVPVVDKSGLIDPYMATALYDTLTEITGGQALADQAVDRWVEAFKAKNLQEAALDNMFGRRIHPKIEAEFKAINNKAQANISVLEACKYMVENSGWGTRQELVMKTATIDDFEATIRSAAINDLRMFMTKMLDLCANKGANVAHFGSAMDNFSNACRRIVQDVNSPRLAKLVKLLFADTKISDQLDYPSPSQLEQAAEEIPSSDQTQASSQEANSN